MPTPFELGLKSTVGTAVSVPPLGLLRGVKRQRRSDGPEGQQRGGGGGRGDERTFDSLFEYTGYLQ